MTTTQPQWGRADLHMHTRISDGAYTVEQVLDHVARLGTLDVIAITDHDRLDATLWAYARRDRYPFDIIPGMEVTSAEGHILAWWVTTPITPWMSLEETVAAIHEAGGLACLAHPFHVNVEQTWAGMRRYWNNPNLIGKAGFDAVEVHNGGVVLAGSNAYARRFVRNQPVALAGNSDAHTINAIGSGSTRFMGRTADDLRAALTARTTQAEGSSWPVPAYVEYLRKRQAGITICDLPPRPAMKS